MFFVKLLKYFFAINLLNIIIITIKILTRLFKIYINVIKLLKMRTRNVSMIHRDFRVKFNVKFINNNKHI